MYFTIYYDLTSGAIVGTHSYVEEPQELKENQIFVPDHFIENDECLICKNVNAYYVDLSAKEIKVDLDKYKQSSIDQVNSWLNSKLRPTDYIILKIKEFQILNEDISDLMKQYATIFNQREQFRKTAENLKTQIKSATTVEEIETLLSQIKGG